MKLPFTSLKVVLFYGLILYCSGCMIQHVIVVPATVKADVDVTKK